MLLLIDFDGTIVKDRYPDIGKLKKNAIKVLEQLKEDGHTLTLCTCREEIYLYNAVEFMRGHGIVFDYVNMHPIHMMEKYKNDPRKLTGDIIIDDKILGGLPDDWDDIYNMVQIRYREKYKEGEKVVFIPEDKVYDFGYYGAEGHAVIYEEGCCNMQDSCAVECRNIRPARRSEI